MNSAKRIESRELRVESQPYPICVHLRNLRLSSRPAAEKVPARLERKAVSGLIRPYPG
jgi:hypothetical protein